MSSSSEEQARQSSEVAETESPISPNSRAHAAWNAVKSNLNSKARTSMPNLRRWLSSPQTSESSSEMEAQRRKEDEKDSQFCNSLLGLMQRTGRFDYIDITKEEDQKEKEESTPRASYKERAKRFSWSR